MKNTYIYIAILVCEFHVEAYGPRAYLLVTCEIREVVHLFLLYLFLIQMVISSEEVILKNLCIV